jgi:hypothetical protein
MPPAVQVVCLVAMGWTSQAAHHARLTGPTCCSAALILAGAVMNEVISGVQGTGVTGTHHHTGHHTATGIDRNLI